MEEELLRDTRRRGEEEDRGSQGTLGNLSEASRYNLEQMVRGITIERKQIAEAMFFCIMHSYAYEEITEFLVSVFKLPSVPFPKIMGRLFLLSDILHNCGASVPHAWRYRDK